jgi:hypothetical protein
MISCDLYIILAQAGQKVFYWGKRCILYTTEYSNDFLCIIFAQASQKVFYLEKRCILYTTEYSNDLEDMLNTSFFLSLKCET